MHTKAGFLANNLGELGDPLGYRILLIMPTVYRRYAATRHRHLKGWIREWATEDMYAGVAAMSVEEAWYITALSLSEHAFEGSQLLEQPSIYTTVSTKLFAN